MLSPGGAGSPLLCRRLSRPRPWRMVSLHGSVIRSKVEPQLMQQLALVEHIAIEVVDGLPMPRVL